MNESGGSRTVTIGAALLFTVCALRWLLRPWTCNHDVGWFLHVAGRLLDGDRLYVDVIDVNPPLIVYLSAAPVACARAMGLSEIWTFHAAVLLAAAVSTWMTARVVARLDLPLSRAGKALGLAAIIYVLVLAPDADFGQREHLLVIAILPWLAITAARNGGDRISARLALLAGAMAGVGFGLKPYFTLAPALVVLSGTLRMGRRALLTPENLALLLVLAVYAAHFAILPGDVLAGLGETLATAWATYDAYDRTPLALLTDPMAVECLLLGCAWILAPATARGRALCTALGWTWLGLFAAALWQHKGWSYHFLGAASAGRLLLAAVAVLALTQGRRVGSWALGVVLAALTLTALTERTDGGWRMQKPHRGWLAHAERVRSLADGGPVLVLDTDLAPHFPAFNHTGLTPTSRYACLWPLPGLRFAEPTAGERIERRLRTTLLEDVAARPPTLVVLGLPPLFAMEPSFDLLAWLQHDAAFAAFWRSYELVQTTEGLAFYRRRR